MITILLSWLVIAGISYLSGHFILTILSKFLKTDSGNSFTLTCLSGLAFLAMVCSWISFFSGINDWVFIGISYLTIIWFIFNFKKIKYNVSNFKLAISSTPKILIIFFAFAGIVLLVYSASPSKCYDEGLYYLQNIKWTYTYPLVPGLSNLECRLGFNSSWHLLAALFSFPFALGYMLDDINGFVYLLCVLYAIGGIKKLLKKDFHVSHFLSAAMVLPGILFYSSIMGPAADLSVTLFVWIIIILFVEKIDQKTMDKIDLRFILIWLFSSFLITVKLSAITILILPAYLLFLTLRQKHWKAILVLFSMSLLVTIPWLIRNVVLTGFLLYPLPVLNIFQVDWKIPMSELNHLNAAIEGWARLGNNNYDQINAMPFISWVPKWFAQKRIYDKLIIVIFFLSILRLMFFYLKKYKKISGRRHLFIVVFTIFISLVLWFLKAPDLRFAYAYMICFIVISLSLVYRNSMINLTPKILKLGFVGSGFLAFSMMLMVLYVLNKESSYSATAMLLKPAAYPTPLFQELKVDGHPVFVPKGFQCWDGPLPCQLQLIQHPYHFRGKTLAEGFRAE